MVNVRIHLQTIQPTMPATLATATRRHTTTEPIRTSTSTSTYHTYRSTSVMPSLRNLTLSNPTPSYSPTNRVSFARPLAKTLQTRHSSISENGKYTVKYEAPYHVKQSDTDEFMRKYSPANYTPNIGKPDVFGDTLSRSSSVGNVDVRASDKVNALTNNRNLIKTHLSHSLSAIDTTNPTNKRKVSEKKRKETANALIRNADAKGQKNAVNAKLQRPNQINHTIKVLEKRSSRVTSLAEFPRRTISPAETSNRSVSEIRKKFDRNGDLAARIADVRKVEVKLTRVDTIKPILNARQSFLSDDKFGKSEAMRKVKVPETTPYRRASENAHNTSSSSTYSALNKYDASGSSSQFDTSGGNRFTPLRTTSRSSVSSNSSIANNATTKTSQLGLNGLQNIGNTCFMNSVVQCLSNTRPLLEYIRNGSYLMDVNTTTSGMKGALFKAFAAVIQELWSSSEGTGVNTAALKSQIQKFAPRFIGYAQQDAQEFLRYLLEGLHEDVNRISAKPAAILTEIDDKLTDVQKAEESWRRYLRMENSAILDLFVGQLKSTLKCTVCGHCSVTFDPFWDLSLPIDSSSITSCLEHFTKEEILDGHEKPTCSKCQKRQKCTKSLSIQKFPKILVLHLKRFSPTERFRGKLSTQVDFPLTGLDLSAFAASSIPAGSRNSTYTLYAISNHSGTTYSGHYTAYCKHPFTGEWHQYNDSRVTPISSKRVNSSEAYVLFYELTSRESSHL